MSRVHDRGLLDVLESLGGHPLTLSAWRVGWRGRTPLQGSTAAGRWTPPGEFEALYASLDADGATAEIYHHLSQQPLRASADNELLAFNVETRSTLDLTDASVLAELGLGPGPLALTPEARSREVGGAAHFLEFDSIVVPSARWSCRNLLLICEHLQPGALTASGPATAINWPAWRERNAARFDEIQAALRRSRSTSRG